jgi:Flp pilus assembly protein TadG
MIRRWRDFARHESGASAIELALVLPIVVALLLLGANEWLQLRQTQDMSSALHTGARYYQEGGADDNAARTLALSAWPNAPQDASLAVTRTCKCGATVVACSTVCNGTDVPQTIITLTTRSTFEGMSGSSAQARQETVRVR